MICLMFSIHFTCELSDTIVYNFLTTTNSVIIFPLKYRDWLLIYKRREQGASGAYEKISQMNENTSNVDIMVTILTI